MLDTGEGKAEYVPILESVLKERVSEHPVSPMVSDVIISHDHHDHWGGVPQILHLLRELWETKHSHYPFVPPRIHKAPGSLSVELRNLLSKLDSRDFLPAAGGETLHDLTDDQLLKGSGVELHILQTPGHTQDSICLMLKEERSLFTADMVLGAGSAVFNDLTKYMKSLDRLNLLASQYRTIYPGHGPVIQDGPAKVQEYIQHRLERENEILQVLANPPPNSDHEGWKIMDIVAKIYAAYPRTLWEWAGRLVLLHLEKLEYDGRVQRVGEEAWKLA
jgi:ribonuclease/clavin/mitogillin